MKVLLSQSTRGVGQFFIRDQVQRPEGGIHDAPIAAVRAPVVKTTQDYHWTEDECTVAPRKETSVYAFFYLPPLGPPII